MPAIPTVTLDPVVEGDTWPGIPGIGPVTINTEPPAYAADQARLHFRRVNATTTTGIDLSTETGGIVIVDAATWELSVPPVPYPQFSLTQGNWEADLEITDSAGTRLTVARFVLPVLRQITK
jgi:hypothetical protein